MVLSWVSFEWQKVRFVNVADGTTRQFLSKTFNRKQLGNKWKQVLVLW